MVRAALYAGYGHSRIALAGDRPPDGLLRAAAEDVAVTMEGLVVRLDPRLLRDLFEVGPAAALPTARHGGEADEDSVYLLSRAFDYGLAVAVVECDVLEAP